MRWLVRLGFLFLFALPAFGQGVRYDNFVLKPLPAGGVTSVSGALITVCTSAGSGTPCTPKVANIYSDEALTTPITGSGGAGTTNSDSFGNYGFYIAPGDYVVTITGTGITSALVKVTLACTAASGCTYKTINNALYASQFAGVDAAAKLTACISAASAANAPCILDFVGNQTWGSSVTMVKNVNIIPNGNCATFDATSLTASPFLTTTAGVDTWKFIGAGTGNGQAANGCTTFKVANTSAQNINLIDQNNIELCCFSVLRTSGSGGDVIDAQYLASSAVHDIHAASISSGAKWADGYRIQADGNGSSIYNNWWNVAMYTFSASVTSVSANGFHITGGGGGKVVNQNNFLQLVAGGVGSGTATNGFLADGTNVNENHVLGDFSNNLTAINLANGCCRNMDFSSSTAEGSAGTLGLLNGTSNIFTTCRSCEMTGNTTGTSGSGQITDNGASSNFTGNYGGVVQNFGVSAAGDTGVNSLCIGGTTCAANSINGPNGWNISASGTTIALVNTTQLTMNRILNAGLGISVNALLISQTSPTIAAAGCGGGAASIVAPNGTAAFKINVGTTPGSACTITMPAATTGWNCFATDITTNSTSVFLQKQTGAESTTSVTITNFNDVAVATAFVASDILKVSCHAD